jgi:hypothetical protein
MPTDKIREILLSLISGVTEDGLAHLTSFDSMKNRVDQARQSLVDYFLEIVGKDKDLDKIVKEHKSQGGSKLDIINALSSPQGYNQRGEEIRERIKNG